MMRQPLRLKPSTLIATSIALILADAPVWGNPTGPQVVNGQVGFARPNASTLNVTNSPGAIVNWQGFSIGASEVTRFIQQSAASAVLNRVVGGNISQIQGQLLSNGKVFLINPSGIVVGPGAVIDTAGFVGSTLNMLDADFLAGKLKFQGDASSGSIINQGWIKTASGGQVILVAPQIENSGLIHTPGGEIILAAGKSLTIASLDHEGVQFEVQAPADAVVNVGKLLAEGGAIGVFAGTLKHSGDIRATSLSTDATGKIVLQAQGSVTLDTGSVTSASGARGGAVKVDGGWAGVGGDIRADGENGGGRIDISAGGYLLAATLSATGGPGAGGAINVGVAGKSWENVHAKYDASGASGGSIRHVAGQQITTSATYLANGSSGLGGRIDLAAPATKLLSAQLHADGASGGGQVQVGGEFQGGKGLAADELPNAELLAVSAGSVITANATQSGAGGTVVTWANIDAAMYGDVSARPAASGTGGMIEISSGDKLTYGGTASAGVGGTVLFDPKNIVIGAATGASQFSIVLGYDYVDVQRLKGNDLEANDFFGSAVSLSGTQLAVGASQDDGAGNDDGLGNGARNTGAVYLFNNPFSAPSLAGIIGKGYTGTGNLNVSALASVSYNFGSSVSLSGTQLAVGAPGDFGADSNTPNAGAVYLFNNPFTAPALAGIIGKGYTGTGNLNVSALEIGDRFGVSVSLGGSQLAVGALGDDGAGISTGNIDTGFVGAVYLINNPFTAPALAGVIGKGYTGPGNFDVSALAANDRFGASVSLSGTQLAVGASSDDGAADNVTDAGAVYIFNNPFIAPTLAGVIGKGYTGPGNFDVSALEANDNFGFSVSLGGSQLAAGALGDDGAGNGFSLAGAVYLINNPFSAPVVAGVIGKGYTGPGNFDVSALAANDRFGSSVSLAGTQLAVGASGDAGAGNATPNAGAVYLFNNPFTAPALAGVIGKGYTGAGNFDVSALAAGDNFGQSVSLAGTQLAVGAPADDGVNSTNAVGAVYLFNNPFTAPALAGMIGKGYTGSGNFDVTALAASDSFGTSVSLSGTQLAVGAPGDAGALNNFFAAGAVYLFNNPFTAPALAGVIGKGYTGPGNFDVSALEGQDSFGSAVSLAGTQLAVGASLDNGAGNAFPQAGAVYLINNPFTTPALAGVIGKGYTGPGNFDVSALEALDNFGQSVSLAGTQLAVGAPNDSGAGNSASAAGAAYLFNNPFSTPTLAGVIGKGYTGGGNFDVSALEANDGFGRSVSLAGTQLAVGARFDDGAGNTTINAGAVYLFNNPFTTPTLAGVIGKGYTGSGNLDVSALAAGDLFGSAVSLSGTQLAVGALGDDGAGNATSAAAASFGAVYSFNLAGGGDAVASATFANNPGADSTITPAAITAITDTGTAVTLQANNDITLATGSPIVTAEGGAGGNITMQAGRSVILNANIFTDNGNLTITANDPAALAANRDAGAGGIAMAAGTTLNAGTGTVALTVGTGVSGALSGNLVVENITAANVNLQQNGRTSGSSILRASSSSLIVATNLLMEVDFGGLASGGSIGTSAAPMRVQTSTLEAHTHEASPGIFIDSPNAGNLQIGGVSFFTGGVKGVQNVTSGDITVAVNGTLTLQSGNPPSPSPCGFGATGGPVCTTSGNITLRADDMSIGNIVKAAASDVTLTPFSTTRDILIISPTAPPPGVLSLDTAELQRVTAGATLEIGRSTDTGTLTVTTGLASTDINASTLKLAHQNIALNQAINFSAGGENLTLTPGNQTSLSSNVTLGGTPSVNATLTLNGATNWIVGRTITGAGASSSFVAVPSGAALTLSGGGAADGVFSNLTVNNAGVINLQTNGGAENLFINSGAVLNNVPGGQIRFVGPDQRIGTSGNPGTLNNSGGTISLVGGVNGLIDPTTFTMTAGAIDVPAPSTLTIAGNGLDWQGGALGGAGTYSVSSLSITGTSARVLDGPTLSLSSLTVPGGSLEVRSGTLNVSGATTVDPGATLQMTGGAFAPSGALNNSGTFDVDVGTVNLGGGGTSAGTFDVAAGATVNFSGGTHNLGDGALLAGGGTFGITGGAFNVTGTTPGATLAAGATLQTGGNTVGGTGTFTNLGTVDASGSTMNVNVVNQGTFDVATGSTNVTGGLTQQAGTINVAAGQTLTVGGTGLDWQGGALLGTSAASYSISVFTFSGSGARVLDGPTFNFSNLTVPGGSMTLQSGALNLSGTTTISSGATLAAAGGAMTATGPVTVGGMLQASAAGSVSAAGQTVTVPTAGVLDVNGGTVTAGLVNVTGGLVKGAGTVAANVNNSAGTVAPGASPGILTITGNYTQGPSGVLNTEIAGTTPGSQYDQLVVTGNVALDGTLNTVFLGGFVPSAADTFNLVQAGGTLSGTFATTNLPAGTTLSASYLPSAFDLMTVASSAGVVTSPPVSSFSTDIIVAENQELFTAAAELGPAAPGEDTSLKPAPMCR